MPGSAYRSTGLVPEIRKDYATSTWVVFSAARSQRPGAFRNPKDATAKESCPFCEGHPASRRLRASNEVTGFYINPVVPEDAAAILKGEIRWSARSEASTP